MQRSGWRSLPAFDQARAVQIDIDAKYIGMRYPYEVNLVGEAAATLRALIPKLRRKQSRSWREKIEANVARWWTVMEAEATVSADPINPCGCSTKCPLGCPTMQSSPPTQGPQPTGTPASCASATASAAPCQATWPPWDPLCPKGSARSSATLTGR